MIKVKVSFKDNLISKVSILGHADYEEYGKDIVCSAVSSIVTTTINDILTLDSSAISYDSKEGNVLITNKDNKLADKLLKTMLNTLSELSEAYPENIKIGG